MESSRRDLFINMVVDWFIFKNSSLKVSPYFTFIPKTDVELRKTVVSFHCCLLLKFGVNSVKLDRISSPCETFKPGGMR